MNAQDKPLHKDPSFWIVAVVLVSAASATQLYYGIPWFTQRLLQAQSAPRSMQFQAGAPSGQTPDLDTSKKTYSWQSPRFVSEVLEKTPPQVVLIPTEYAAPSGRLAMKSYCPGGSGSARTRRL